MIFCSCHTLIIRINRWINLEGTKQGQVHLSLYYKPVPEEIIEGEKRHRDLSANPSIDNNQGLYYTWFRLAVHFCNP